MIPIEISARHVHLSKDDLEILFGKDYKLKNIKQLTQPSDFVAEETVDLKSGDKEIKKVRVVGPERNQTQVEISMTDAVSLGVVPPIRISGDLKGSAKITLIGPKGVVDLNEGLIISGRHIHCNETEAKSLGIKNKDKVSVKVEGERSITFHNIAIRIGDKYKLCLHLDTDEGNAAGINKKTEGIIIK